MEKGVTEAEYVNDLEPPAFKAMPSLQQMKLELQVCDHTHELHDGFAAMPVCRPSFPDIY